VSYSQPADLERVRGSIAALGINDVQVQNFGTAQEVLIRMPVQKGSDAAAQSEKVFAALKAGAHGYLIKTGGALKVLRTLDDVAEGGVPLDPQIAGLVLQAFQQLPQKRESIGLSEQETEVLRRIAKGMTKKEVAQDMSLSLHTVDNYLRRAFEKLHVQSLPAAVAAAIRSGLLDLA
jgi:DNA-binding NarL/FixJ family response regulator